LSLLVAEAEAAVKIPTTLQVPVVEQVELAVCLQGASLSQMDFLLQLAGEVLAPSSLVPLGNPLFWAL
jgi:hypothetical protein